VDISAFAKPGETVQLAMRVTDPGGNYDWRDGDIVSWGKYKIPGRHAFGGITGRVKLIACAPVYVNDIYVQNTAAITEIRPQIMIINSTAKEIVCNILVRVVEKKNQSIEITHKELKKVKLTPGENLISAKILAPSAKLWDLEHPNLYICKVSVTDGKKTIDEDDKTFGFRWFEPTGQGTDAMFRLNGKRIVLRTAISWGYWPINGIYPTEEMAEKQIRTAKAMGHNMLSFHRCVGALGGVYFAKQHPLFSSLPTNEGMNWPYQAVVRNGSERFALEVEGEELIAGAYHCYPMKLGTAVGIIPCGKGKIIFSTLDICGNLASKESSANVARKLLCNFIEYSGK
jgi:hypothetical protein